MAQVSITLPKELQNDLDNYCERNKLQRSELIRHLIRIEIYHKKSLGKNGGDKR